MHGLINRALQNFLRDTYGSDSWATIAAAAQVEGGGFEAMLPYPEDVTDRVIAAAAAHLTTPPTMILEDLGTYLVSDPGMEALRRLLRFGGATFLEFLYSLDDLPDRIRLAVPDLALPRLELVEDGRNRFLLRCNDGWPGFCCMMLGILRAMADDYGALVMLESSPGTGQAPTLRVRLLDMRFAEGRRFSLRGSA
ncbi:heme-NO-binding protein [Rhodovulum bhavnagarense]|uniref:Heme-NO-binding protein n=1 Tax=Rhodovulum bhavnagarense TaxID=992286 RepID=A0A4R2RIN1_9RHOB|nr:heme NO-binding domain-containing protein [Rhodovulum bhavnagarense]TCP62339.1 heme-NO-binding protein [Rhodovulum bhavnagarense]